jgi:CheY-like chemotaxis protein
MDRAAEGNIAIQQVQMEALERKTILLVEDEPIIALAASRTIEGFGYLALAVSSGEKAVELSSENDAIKLILMDIDLGKGMSGSDAAELILRRRHLPIVFLTSIEMASSPSRRDSGRIASSIASGTPMGPGSGIARAPLPLWEAKARSRASTESRGISPSRSRRRNVSGKCSPRRSL